MAAVAKDCKKKGKGKQLSLQEFLGDDTVGMVKPISWADEMEGQLANDDLDFGLQKVVINRTCVTLPTAPRAVRGPDVDLTRVPCIPPFTAFLGNLPYDITSDEIERFFRGMKLQCVSVRLPQDQGRPKGFGYAEFETKQSLIDALSLNQATLRNRQIRIDLAEQNQDKNIGESERVQRSERDDKTPGDWRRHKHDYNPLTSHEFKGHRSNFQRDDKFSPQQEWYSSQEGSPGWDSVVRRDGGYKDISAGGDGYRGDTGGGRDREWEKQDLFRDPVMRETGGGGRGRRGRGGGGPRSFDRSGGVDHGRSNGRPRLLEERRSEGHLSYTGPTSPDFPEDRGGSGYSMLPRSISTDESHARTPGVFPNEGGSGGEPPKERRRLVLKPRTAKQEPGGGVADANRPSIFGGAKPVDTSLREREIEERLIRQKQELEKENQQEPLADDVVGNRRTSTDALNRSQSTTSSEYGRTRKESGSSQEGGGGAGSGYSLGRRERKSSSSSGKGIRTVMPPPSVSSRSRRDSARSEHDDVFSEDSTPPKTPLPLVIKEETPRNIVLAPQRPSTENVWDHRRSRGEEGVD